VVYVSKREKPRGRKRTNDVVFLKLVGIRFSTRPVPNEDPEAICVSRNWRLLLNETWETGKNSLSFFHCIIATVGLEKRKKKSG
jgi:hypothetical protein